MLRRLAFLFAAALSFTTCIAQTLYVATTGDDTAPGTPDAPLKTLAKAVSLAAQGTTIYVRQGTYVINTVIAIAGSGAAGDTCRLLAYSGERALLDCSSMVTGGSNRGIFLTGSYWHIRGLDIAGAGDNGMRITGSHNVIEKCTFRGNRDTGLQLDGGAASNLILNCDSYGNADPQQGNADGFAPKLGVGTGNVFRGCRAWQNSDDGWDGYLRGSDDVTTTLEECWSFMNGYLGDGATSNGNGNGFKMGGSDTANLAHNMILRRCLAIDNRVKGFDQNHDRGSMTLLNCTAYRNGTNYSIAEGLRAGKTAALTNCVALGFTGSIGSFAVQATNSWGAPFITTDSDFLSLDTTGVRGARKPDGGLPDVSFMHLSPGSDLIDAGTEVGLPFSGRAADLGAFESSSSTDVTGTEEVPTSFALLQNYPNPFNASTTVTFSLPTAMDIRLSVFDVLGREVVVLAVGRLSRGIHKIRFDGANLPSGTYFCRIAGGAMSQTRSLVLLK